MADNWYVILGLEFDPPVEDEQDISKRIEEKSKFWSMHFNDFKMGAQYRAWHQNIPRIKKEMLGSANIRKQLASEACALVYGPIDKLLKTIGRKGNITSEEGDKLARKLQISLDVVKKRAGSLGIQWIEGTGADYKSVYDKYYKTKPGNTATYDGMRQMLSSFGADNLYDFLYENTGVKKANKLPCKTLRARAAEKKQTEFYKNDSVSGTGSKLCGQCEIVFKDDSSKEAYDRYLEYVRRKIILDDAKSIAEISDELTIEQGDEIIGQLTEVFRDRKMAEDVLTAFCKIEKIAYNAGGISEKAANIRICRCGCMNDISDGRKVCSNCGLELMIKCPECGTENDANVKVCKCGFKFENIDKAVALCEQAEYAIESLNFAVAQVHLSDAEHYWPNSNKVTALKEHLAEYEKRVGTAVTKMREEIKNRCYCEAKKQYSNIQQLFSEYSDSAVEDEINQAIGRAMSLYNTAKLSKDEKEILELCSKAYDICADLPGITELIPAPANVTGFKVVTDAALRANIISWEGVDDRSIRYIVVRSKDGWVQNLSDGQVIFKGSRSSCTDSSIEAGIPYYYNVFAERAGVYSKGASGDFKEIVNLFEVQHAVVTAGDSSLDITWDALPDNAIAEIYEIKEGNTGNHITSSTVNSYLVTNLENDKPYKYRISLSYMILGKKRETKGVIIIGVPTCIPLPVDTLRVKPLRDNQFEAVWVKSSAGEVRLYGSADKPIYHIGDAIALSELETKMSRLQEHSLSAQTLRNVRQDEAGILFQYSENKMMYVTAVIVKTKTAVFGNTVRVNSGESVTVKSIRPVNGRINIYIEPPENATGFVVLYRFDQFPTDIEDVKTVRKYIPLKQYRLNSAIVLETLEERKYYFTVYAEFKEDGEKDYSFGTECIFDNSAKVNIIYSISINRKLFGESNMILEFEANCHEFVLPDIEIMSSIGNTPVFKASAELFSTIPSQMVNGSLKVKVPIPKTLPKNTYIKAFFKDDSMQKSAQLRLKLKSNYKIS